MNETDRSGGLLFAFSFSIVSTDCTTYYLWFFNKSGTHTNTLKLRLKLYLPLSDLRLGLEQCMWDLNLMLDPKGLQMT